MRIFSTLVFALAVALSGCGYGFQGSSSSLPDDIETVFVEPVQNNTTYAGIHIELRDTIRDNFERFRALEVVDRKGQADAIVNAKILSLDTRVQTVTGETDIELSREVTLRLFASLRRSNGAVLWQNPSIEVSEPVPSTSDLVVTSSSDFAQAGIDAGTLSTLSTREVERGAAQAAFSDLADEAARQLYLGAVGSDF